MAVRQKRTKGGWSSRVSPSRGGGHHVDEIVPKDFLRIAPVPSANYKNSEVVARTSTIRVCDNPPRGDFAQSNYARRSQQIGSHGFMTPATERYAELGDVEMNTKALIVRTLGQPHVLDEHYSSGSSDEEDNLSAYSSSSSIGFRVPDDGGDMLRLTVEAQVRSSTKRLGDVKLGRCLFNIVRKEEKERLRMRQEAAWEESKRLRFSWKPVKGTGQPAVSRQQGSFTSLGLTQSRMSAAQQGEGEDSVDGTQTSLDNQDYDDFDPSSFSMEILDEEPAERPSRQQRAPSARVKSAARNAGSESHMAAAASTVESQGKAASAVGGSQVSFTHDLGSGRSSSASCDGGGGGSAHGVAGTSHSLDSVMNANNSSVQIGACSRTTVNSIGSDDDDDDCDVIFMHKYLCSLKWILEGMLVDNPAALPSIIETWLPMTRNDTPQQHQQRLHSSRVSNDKWLHVTQPTSPKKARHHVHQPAGQRYMRRPQLSLTETSLLHSPRSELTSGSPRSTGIPPNSPFRHAMLRFQFEEDDTIEKTQTKTKLTREELHWLVDHVNVPSLHPRKGRPYAKVTPAEVSPFRVDRTLSPSGPENAPIDPARMHRRFNVTRARRNLIAQTQLMAMERERYKTCQQKFEALLKLKGNARLWEDLEKMRSGVETESAAMAKRKLLMNYKWFEDLLQSLPEVVVTDRLCSKVVCHLERLFPVYLELGPERLDKTKLFDVLSRLQVWEGELPEVSKAIEFARNHVIFVPDKEFRQWRAVRRLEASRSAVAQQQSRNRAKPGLPPVPAPVNRQLSTASDKVSQQQLQT